MDRYCTECGGKIGNKFNVMLQKQNYTGDLCEECWNKEWEKSKHQSRNMEIYKDGKQFIIHLPNDICLNKYEEIAIYISFVKGKIDEVWIGEEEREFVEGIHILDKKV